MDRTSNVGVLQYSGILIGGIWCVLMLAACGGSDSGRQVTPLDRDQAPAQLDSLQALLDSELLRLGVDTSREASIAPSAGNAVFDLQATVTTVVPGEQADVSLRWTERLVGDYDRNGLVNAADLVPLARHFGEAVSYRSALDTDGIEGWPTGLAYDPGDAANWRLARIDGNMDGEINAGDVTPIAQHWQQSLSGYRVYRQHGDQEAAELLNGPQETLGLFSVERSPSDDNNRPVTYSFSDTLTDAGEYLYYVAAYDSGSDGEGPPSRPVRPSLNIPPVATLSVDPPNGAAPLQVSLDASASTDPDGRIVSYEFDLDGDGKYDQTGIDPDATASFGSGSHTVRLRVTDDAGASDRIDLTINVGDEIIPLITSNKQADMLPAVFLLDSTLSQVSIPLSLVEWFVNDDELPSQSGTELDTFLFEPEFTGFHQVRLVLTSQSGYSYETKISLQVYDGDDSVPLITVNRVEDSLPADFTFSADQSILAKPLAICHWFIGQVPELAQTTQELADFSPEFSQPGLQKVTLRLIDIDGGVWENSQTIYVHPAPAAVFSGGENGFWEDDAADFSAADSIGVGLSYQWDLDADWLPNSDDNVFEDDYFTENISFQCLDNGTFTLILRVTDRFGKQDETSAECTVHRRLSIYVDADENWYEQGDRFYEGQLGQLLIYPQGGPYNGILSGWEMSFPGTEMPSLSGESFGQNNPLNITWFEPGQIPVHLELQQNVSEVTPPELIADFTIDVAAFDPQFTADSFFKSAGNEITFDISASVSDLPVANYGWDWESDGNLDHTGLESSLSHTFAQGTYTVTMHMYAQNGYSRSVSHQAGVLDGEVVIIRNDGNTYDANYDAITSDLDELGIAWSGIDYYPGIADDESGSSNYLYIWYRGGPGAESEARPYTTMWTSTEIDDYLALMNYGKNLLVMSQAQGKDPDAVIEPNLWVEVHGMSLVPNTVPAAELRHPWAVGLQTDDRIGFGGTLGWTAICPQNLYLDGSHDLTYGTDGTGAASRFTGAGSSGKIPIAMRIENCYQFSGIGYYSAFWGTGAPGLSMGVNGEKFLEFDLGFMSYGNRQAPDANIGFFPSYQHTAGPARMWVVCYPWNQLSIISSYPVGMSRAEALQNILGWLREDDWAAF
ncbi:hypothetical protein KDL44_10155 [bacterium]|nr:hypothetical protein [bacterium]